MEEQKILLNERVMWYKKKMQAFAGTLTITENRLFFNQDKIHAPGTGLLGAVITSAVKKTRGGVILDASISDLKFSRGKQINKKSFIFEVTTNQEDVFKFLFDDRWLEKVESVINLQ